MKTRRALGLVAVLGLSSFGLGDGGRRADAGEGTPDLGTLSWLGGSWEGKQGELEMEEHWSPPKGASMLGLHRDVKGSRTVSFEFLRIEAGASGIVYWASPGGKPAVPFRLVESKAGRAVFENPDHDFPQRILYWLGEDGALHARVEGSAGGRAASEEWSWRRQACPGR